MGTWTNQRGVDRIGVGNETHGKTDLGSMLRTGVQSKFLQLLSGFEPGTTSCVVSQFNHLARWGSAFGVKGLVLLAACDCLGLTVHNFLNKFQMLNGFVGKNSFC